MGSSIKKDDVVAVMGGLVENTGKFTSSFTVHKVVEVGFKDLALVQHPPKSWSRIEIVPKKCCIKISTDSKSMIRDEICQPKLGDLVVAFPGSYGKESEPYSGILYGIEYVSGSPRTVRILCGEEVKSEAFDRIMVLQRDDL